MKKGWLLALITALLLMLLCAACQAETTNYRSNFSGDADGWYARGASGTQIQPTREGLAIKGREQDWHSMGRDFDLIAGKPYSISVKVKQTQVKTATFILSAALTKNGSTSYVNLVRGTASMGDYLTLSAEYTAGDYDTITLYIETADAPTLEYVITAFTLDINALVYRSDLPRLKELYASDFDMGCALGQIEAVNTERMDFLASQFSIMTPGNELKPDYVLDVAACKRLAKTDETAVAVHFDSAKPLLDYAKQNGVKIHGHVLLWHSQTPAAFFKEGYDINNPFVTREVMLGRMENYIKAVFAYTGANYPGVIVSWDVVNEAIADGTGKLRQSNWTKVVGDDFIHRAFEFAKKYAPKDVLLYYNDYNTVYQPKLDGIYDLLRSLQKEGNIDGYGFQCHYSVGSPDVSAFAQAIAKISQTGLKLRVSEMDLGIAQNTDAYHRAQADAYKAYFDVFMQYADALEAVTLWGTSDDASWRADVFPLLFDKSMQPKYAFYALTDPTQIPADVKTARAYAFTDNLYKATAYTFDKASFRCYITQDGVLKMNVMVMMKEETPTDAVTLYLDGFEQTIARADGTKLGGGYSVTFEVPRKDIGQDDTIAFDVMVRAGDRTFAYGDGVSQTARREMASLLVTPVD